MLLLLGLSSLLGGLLNGDILSLIPFLQESRANANVVGVVGFEARLIGGGCARFAGIGELRSDWIDLEKFSGGSKCIRPSGRDGSE